MPFFPNSRLISLAVTISLLFQTSWYFTPSLAATPVRPSATVLSIRPEIAPVLEKSIRDSIAAIYGAEQVKTIYPQVVTQIRKARQQRPKALVQEDLIRKPDWYKDEVMYMLYADRFGISDGKEYTSFKDVAGTLDYLKRLGVTTLYILPFMDSPMGDAGFDVRNFKSVREDLGGLREFQAFAQEAHKRGFKIKADLILNHISDQHAWFQAALKGDPDKLNYFVYSTKEPKYKKYRDPQKGIVVDYEEEDGQISSRSLIFPDMAKTHYREEKINGQSYYFYHSFYPFQMDINWKTRLYCMKCWTLSAFGPTRASIFSGWTPCRT